MNTQQQDKKILYIIEQIKNLVSITKYPSLESILQDIKTEINNKEFRITVVGEFSSGKSTFLNAIIGKDILPHGVKETTAAITYIHNVSESDSLLNKVIIHFNDKDAQDKVISIDKDNSALIDYVTTSENKYKVVKDIASVDIYVHFTDNQTPIVLIDTPGMNGVAEGHRELTMHEIQRSHASICLFHTKGIGKTDLEFIKEMMYYQNTFFFVLNAIDELKQSEGESYENRILSFKDELTKFVYDGKNIPQHVYGISSLFALVSRDTTINRLFETDKEDLSIEKREKLFIESKMSLFENALYDYITHSDKEKQFYLSIVNRLKKILASLLDSAAQEQNSRELLYENIPERKLLVEMRLQAEEQVAKYRANIEHTLGSMIADLQDEINKIARQDCKDMLVLLNKEVNNLTIDNTKKAIEDNIYGKKLVSFWKSESTRLIEIIKQEVIRINNDVLIELTMSLPKINFKDKRVSIEIDASTFTYQGSTTNGRLEQLKSKLQKKENELKSLGDKRSADSVSKELTALNKEISQIRNERTKRIQNLGQRPKVREWTESYQEETTSTLRKIFTLGFSRTYETRYRTYTDDSEQRYYDKMKEQLVAEYKRKDDSLQSQKKRLLSELEKAEENDSQKELLRMAISRLQDEQNKERREIERLEKEARNSFFKKRLKEIRDFITEQLDAPKGVLLSDLINGISDNMKLCRTAISKEIHELYDRKTQDYINSIECMIERIDNSKSNKENINKLHIVKADIKNINIILNQINEFAYGL